MKKAGEVFKNFTEGNFKDGLEKISEIIDRFNPKEIFDSTYKEIKNQISDMIREPLHERLSKGADKIAEHVSEGIKNISEGKFSDGFDKFKSAGKEFLSCIGKLFGATKEGLTKGFESVKNTFKNTWEKLEALCQTREHAR